MSIADGLQVLGTTIALLVLGFGLGTAHARRRRSSRSLQWTLEALRQALANVEVSSIRVTPETAFLGTQLVIDFDITSKLSTPLEIWLGADIQYAPDQYFYDVTQDKVVSIDPGRHTYSRYLTLAAPLTSGSWTINAGVWFGRKSDPNHSIRLVLRGVQISVG